MSPEPQDRPRRILVYPGTFDFVNAGDTAMLGVALERFKSAWPDVAFLVLTREPARLRELFPGAIPVSMRSCKAWLKRSGFSPVRWLQARSFDHVVASADLLLMSGSGMLNDDFQGAEARVLHLFDAAAKRGLPTAMVGQGIGPMENPTLLARASAVMPSVGTIFVRDALGSLDWLRRCGVSEERITVTGDDAIELAYRARPTESGDMIGVNLRLASYANLPEGIIDVVRSAVNQAAQRRHTSVVGIPITNGPSGTDVQSLSRLIPDGFNAISAERWEPAVAIRQMGRCRVLVAGSYHAGVFALAQGIPVVAVVQSDYYAQKFEGLARQFGCGCTVLQADDGNFAGALAAAIEAAWRESDELRPQLFAAAERQIRAGKQAFADLCRQIEGATAPQKP